MTRQQARAPGEVPGREDAQPARDPQPSPDPALTPSHLHKSTPECGGAGVLAGGLAAVPAAGFQIDSNPAALWLLPTAGGEPWIVSQEPDAARLAQTLAAAPPVFVTPTSHAAAANATAERSRRELDGRWAERMQEAIFEFAKRLLLGLAWVAVSLAGLRIPGEVKFLDEILLLLGLGFLGYTFLRYGRAAWNWMRWRSQARGTFLRATQVASPLLDRLAQALQLRKTLPLEERGHKPDEELLDADAYRGLIRAGLTTPRELSALGRAVAARLGLPEDAPGELKITELSRGAGIDTPSALFYLDLVSAAKKIGPDGDAVEML